VKRGLSLLLGLLLASCGGSGPEAYVFMVDHSFRAELVGGSEAGFAAPDALVWHHGGLLIADEGGSAIRYWRPGGPVQTLAGPGQGLRSPEDMAVDGAGNIYFSDDDAGGVRRIDAQRRTTWLAPPGRGLRSSEGLALAPSGRILVGDQRDHRIYAVAPDGNAATFIGPEAGIGKPESMAFDAEGNLYVADNEADILYLITRDGRLHRPVAGREGFSPESLTFADGALYITDSRNGTLHRYSPRDGLSAVAVFTGELANVQGIAADPAGNLYVSVQASLDEGRGYILRLSRQRRP
jgi:sugar lactone lactonase YvrE